MTQNLLRSPRVKNLSSGSLPRLTETPTLGNMPSHEMKTRRHFSYFWFYGYFSKSKDSLLTRGLSETK
jgi:hypothetical protein